MVEEMTREPRQPDHLSNDVTYSDLDVSAPSSVGRWATAIILSGLLAWLGFTFPPKEWRIPDSMSNIGALSSQADQAKLAANVNANQWKNSLLKFGLAGLGFGLVGLFVHGANRPGPVLVTIVSGCLAGLAAGALGLLLRRYLDKDHPIPIISEEMRPLFADSMVFLVCSVLLILPIAILLLMQPSKVDRHKAASVPFAGVLTGLLVPISVAFIIRGVNLTIFPLNSIVVSSIWFAVLTVLALVLVAVSGPRVKKGEVAI